MGFNEAVPCCCDTTSVCCRTARFRKSCNTSVVDEANCTFTLGDPETLEFDMHFIDCVATQDDCSCQNFNPQTYGGYVMVSCSATFFPDQKCQNGQPPVPRDFCGPEEPIPCQDWACGPCSPRPNGCVLVPPGSSCPPTPSCVPEPCCEPPPPEMCCYYNTSTGCLAFLQCAPCGQDFGSTVVSVPSPACDCAVNGLYVATLCCPSCGWDPNTNQPIYYHCDPQNAPNQPWLWGTQCCYGPTGCANGSWPPNQTCVREGCINTCPAPPLPICPCDGLYVINTCGNFNFSTTYAGTETSAEGRVQTGVFNDGTGYKLNTLFLFGYGYEHL